MRAKLEELVRSVGKQLLTCRDYGIEEKDGIGNYVTQMDTLLQEQLRSQLARLIPEAGFQGEDQYLNSSSAFMQSRRSDIKCEIF